MDSSSVLLVSLLASLFVGVISTSIPLPSRIRVHKSLAHSSFDPTNDHLLRWDEYKRVFGRSFDTDEAELQRFEQFVKVQELVHRHNKAFGEGKTSYKMGLNKFAGMTLDELSSLTGLNTRLGRRGSRASPSNGARRADTESHNTELPESVDWREKDYVTAVKNQSGCGCCWAFCAAGAIEGAHKRATGKLVTVSVQQLIDCSWDYGNAGCHGGLPEMAFQYVIDNGGIDKDDQYPFESPDGDDDKTCRFNSTDVGVKIKGWVEVTSGDEAALRRAVATHGPVSVGIEAPMGFLFYESGIYNDADGECLSGTKVKSKDLTHGVLVVGYGTEKGQDYWLVKNSWGVEGGEKGYVKMARNKNLCGIAVNPSYPIV